MALFEKHYYFNFDGLFRVVRLLEGQAAKIENIMATLQDFQTQFDGINQGLNDIVGDLVRLKEQIAGLGLSSSDEDALLATLTSIRNRVEGIAEETPNPEPEPPVDPVEPGE